METAGWARIFPWPQTLGSSDVQFAKRINHQVMGYPLTPGPISRLHQSHGKAPFSVQLVGERKMPWKERGRVRAQWLHNFVIQYQCGFFSGSVSMSSFFFFFFSFCFFSRFLLDIWRRWKSVPKVTVSQIAYFVLVVVVLSCWTDWQRINMPSEFWYIWFQRFDC